MAEGNRTDPAGPRPPEFVHSCERTPDLSSGTGRATVLGLPGLVWSWASLQSCGGPKGRPSVGSNYHVCCHPEGSY